MPRNEEEGKEEPNLSQDINDTKDRITNEVQDGEEERVGSSLPQSFGEAATLPGDNASSTGVTPMMETGAQMVGLFSTRPKGNQGSPLLNLRAETRKWAEEMEEKYQGRERTLQNLAMDKPLDFKRYVIYLKRQKRPAFNESKELIQMLSGAWQIDMDLELD